jgi:epoxyqueuosine reductase
MESSADELLFRLRGLGFQAEVCFSSRLPSLQREIDGFKDQGLFDGEFCHEYIARFRFVAPENLPNALSLIVVAVPISQSRMILNWNGNRKSLTIPPIYAGFERTRERIEDLIGKILDEKGYSWARPMLPLKLLAVRSGLAEYGRNNICYVQGMGSFLRFVAVYSDMPCETDNW